MKIFYHSPAGTVEYVSEYIFLVSKNKQAKTKKQKARIQKSKGTKKEKRIFPENRLKK